MTGQPSKYDATGAVSSVADMMTTRRSSRADHACLASAMPRSAWMLRSWNSSRISVATSLNSGSCWRYRVRMPSVTTSRRVSLVNCRSNRMCQPISRPIVQPLSSAMRRAIARAATRRGCSSRTRPRSTSEGGTRVVFPAPGAAVSTAARWRSSASAMRGRYESTGSGGGTEYHQSLLVPRSLGRRGIRQGYSSIHGELRDTLEPDPVHTGGGRAEMSKSTPVPTANTFAEAFPNSTKVYEHGVPFREVKLGGGEAPVRLYDTSGPQGHDPKQGLPKLREPWLAQRRVDSRAGKAVTQLHYARRREITPEMQFIATREG